MKMPPILYNICKELLGWKLLCAKTEISSLLTFTVCLISGLIDDKEMPNNAEEDHRFGSYHAWTLEGASYCPNSSVEDIWPFLIDINYPVSRVVTN